MYPTRASLVRAAIAALLLVMALPTTPSLFAQDEEGEGEGGIPRRSGAREVSGAVGQEGMVFELRSARLEIPPGLPIGDSRLLRFAEATGAAGALRPADVADGFRRIGPILSFDGAINASRSPVVLSIRQPRDPGRAGLRVVLAMEQATICQSDAQPRLGGGRLCSGWELLDARFEAGRLRADLPAPGGYRLVFGTVPAPTE